MESDEKIVKPDVVIALTEGQMRQLGPLIEKQRKANAGMISGSVGIQGTTAAFSYIPQKVAEQIRDLAYQELGGENNDNS